MPRVTQYIRDEDFEKWKALPNKSEFIHNALNPGMTTDSFKAIEAEDDKTPQLMNFQGTDIHPAKTTVFEHGEPIPKSFSARKKK